jgi:hypothetical protein
MNLGYAFKIVLLHEDLVSGRRGSSVVDRLAGQLEMDVGQLETEMWKFSVLRDRDLRAHAMTPLIQANMIIIAAAGGTDLPMHIREMIEAALRLRGDHDAAIVALFDWENATWDELPRAGRYLKRLAEKTGLDFFCNKGEWQPKAQTGEISARSVVGLRLPSWGEAVPWNS